MSTYKRINFLPVVTFQEGLANKERLDFLSATYLKIFRRLRLDTYYTVEGIYDSHPELLSYQLYGTPYLWWVLCFYNGIIDPITEIVSGKELKIPTLDSIEGALQGLEKSSVGTIVTIP